MAGKPRKRLFQNGKQTAGSMRRLYLKQRFQAKMRGLAFKLSFEQWLGLISLNCYLCNGKPANAFKHAKKNSAYIGFPDIVYQGLDRIDNSIGYDIKNTAPCCKICNGLKSNLTISGLKKHIKKIVKFQNW